MIKLSKIKVYGFEEAIRGMRNSWESWEDSDFTGDSIGQKNYKLMKRLIKSGSDHRKFMRMINVSMDILAPLYWWKEFDVYKIGTNDNSCSTMHTIYRKEFTTQDFSCEKLRIPSWKDGYTPIDTMLYIIDELNNLRDIYINGLIDKETGEVLRKPKDKEIWYQMIQLLPSSYNQLRTITLNYEVLLRIYNARKDHKLDEWRDFCKMIKILPVHGLISADDEDGNFIGINPYGITGCTMD